MQIDLDPEIFKQKFNVEDYENYILILILIHFPIKLSDPNIFIKIHDFPIFLQAAWPDPQLRATSGPPGDLRPVLRHDGATGDPPNQPPLRSCKRGDEAVNNK